MEKRQYILERDQIDLIRGNLNRLNQIVQQDSTRYMSLTELVEDDGELWSTLHDVMNPRAGGQVVDVYNLVEIAELAKANLEQASSTKTASSVIQKLKTSLNDIENIGGDSYQGRSFGAHR